MSSFPLHGHVGCFQFSAFVNSTAVAKFVPMVKDYREHIQQTSSSQVSAGIRTTGRAGENTIAGSQPRGVRFVFVFPVCLRRNLRNCISNKLSAADAGGLRAPEVEECGAAGYAVLNLTQGCL